MLKQNLKKKSVTHEEKVYESSFDQAIDYVQRTYKTVMDVVNQNMKQPQIALIDSQESIQRDWQKKASENGKEIHVFSSIDEFLDQKLNKNIQIYLDKKLGEEGSSFAEKLFQHGYSYITIITSEDYLIEETPYDLFSSIRNKHFPIF